MAGFERGHSTRVRSLLNKDKGKPKVVRSSVELYEDVLLWSPTNRLVLCCSESSENDTDFGSRFPHAGYPGRGFTAKNY